MTFILTMGYNEIGGDVWYKGVKHKQISFNSNHQKKGHTIF